MNRIIAVAIAIFSSVSCAYCGPLDATDCENNTSGYYTVPGDTAERVNRRLVSCVNYLLDLQRGSERYTKQLISLLEMRVDALAQEVNRLQEQLNHHKQ
jgi:hypothetical protein